MIITGINNVRQVYKEAAEKGWVLPCVCSENQTTTEAILQAAQDFGKENGLVNVPVIIAITCNYDHRTQAKYYSCARDTNIGLKLFTQDIITLAGPGGPYSDVKVMIHLDHIQHDTDYQISESDLSYYASIMYDASTLPFEENIKKTAGFVKQHSGNILIEGACDEIKDASGNEHNSLTTPENAERYINNTGVDLIVANLGTEHRAAGKELIYNGALAREIKAKAGQKIVLHGTSSVTNDQIKNLFSDGIVKVNIWTALERDSSPQLFYDMVKNASKVAGNKTAEQLINEGYLTPKCLTNQKSDLSFFTTTYRQELIFNSMKNIVKNYFYLWYN